ncbi:restriction endonuclease subunit S [Faecalibacter rhinopitheci]|uniref:restriction endonuclease subunit S n=1 Tax=Faecalibacter rhinopitheci TaxID=2779678 RepID=UPI001D16E73D|nr:restriction endonuclease subunit S [Faecalibacter rhinopitheci]
MKMGNSLLEFTNLVNLNYWSVAFLKEQKNSFKNKFELIPISKILKRSKNIINIENTSSYKRVTIKLYSKGVFLRDDIKGSEIGVKRQYIASKGQFILSKIDARNGAFGIVPDFLDGAIVTNDFPLFNIDTNIINPSFFFLLTSTNVFIDLAKSCSSGTTNRQRIEIEVFLKFKIPLPSLQEQQEIVDAYFAKINESNQLEEQAKNIDQEIEKFLFTELGISSGDKINKKKKGLNLVNFTQLERWDTEFILGYQQKLVSKYPLVKYNDLFVSVNNGVSSRFYSNEGIRFLKVSDIKENCISDADIRYVNKYNEKDLLKDDYLLITRKGTVGNSYYKDIGIFIASSEVFIIKIDKSKVLGNYIAEINLSNFIQNQYKEKYTGTIMPSLSQGKLKEIIIPLPPLEIQKSIIENIQKLKYDKRNIFNKAELLKLQANEEFENAIFQ